LTILIKIVLFLLVREDRCLYETIHKDLIRHTVIDIILKTYSSDISKSLVLYVNLHYSCVLMKIFCHWDICVSDLASRYLYI